MVSPGKVFQKVRSIRCVVTSTMPSPCCDTSKNQEGRLPFLLCNNGVRLIQKWPGDQVYQFEFSRKTGNPSSVIFEHCAADYTVPSSYQTSGFLFVPPMHKQFSAFRNQLCQLPSVYPKTRSSLPELHARCNLF